MTPVRDRSHRPTTGLGVLAGLLTACVALGVAQLVAGIGRPPGSPVAAVGSLAIDHTPPVLKNFAIATFGSHDKTALVTGILVVLALLAGGHRRGGHAPAELRLRRAGRVRGHRPARRADPAERRRGGRAAHPGRCGGRRLHARHAGPGGQPGSRRGRPGRASR